MIKVKTFSTQLKIFHTRNELEELDRQVNEFIASHGVRKVISVSDASTAGGSGETIGLIRTLAYEAPASEAREQYQEKIEAKLQEWGKMADEAIVDLKKGVSGAAGRLKKSRTA